METAYKIASITAATAGRKLHTYDSWYGSSESITIEDVEQFTNSVKFTGTNAWGGKSEIYVYNDCIASLLLTGEAQHHNEIERCDIVTRYDLI